MLRKHILPFIITAVFFLAAMNAIGQHRTITWETLQEAGPNEFPFTFRASPYTTGEHELPVYFEEINPTDPGQQIRYSIQDAVYEPIGAGNTWNLTTEIIPEVETVWIRKKTIARITFVPLRINPQTGQTERLLSFRPEITYIAAKTPGQSNNLVFADASLLRQGNWYKLGVTRTGVHRITYNDLQAWGINPDGIDPRTLSLHGFGGGMLPEMNSQQTLDDMAPVAIYVAGEQDGKFDPNDYLLFYGESPHIWRINPLSMKMDHVTNIYEDTTYYYMTWNIPSPLRIENQNSTSLNASHQVRSFMQPLLHEKDLQLMTKSGKQWFGETFDETSSIDFHFEVPDIDPGKAAILEISVAGRSFSENAFVTSYNGTEISTISIAGIQPTLLTRVYARPGNALVNFMPESGNITLNLKHVKNNAFSIGYLDYLELNVPRKLTFRGPQLAFNYIPRAGQGQVPEFYLENAGEEVHIWIVNEARNPKRMVTQKSGETQVFKLQGMTGFQFVAFDGSDYPKPAFMGRVPNQNLHAVAPVDYIIVSPSQFLGQARRLAQLHEQHSGLTTHVADLEEIFNEFSSGAKDPVGIRTFVRMLYERSGSQNQPRYLLLFGDGSYDPKNRQTNDHNIIPAFQSRETITIVSSYVTDDFYGLMDPSEGVDGAGALDIGIGRFPVTTDEQAKNMVDKIEQYLSGGSPMHLPWRNTFCLVADDQDNNTHFDQAEKLALILDTATQVVNVNKIYLDAYKQSATSQGSRYPDVNKAIEKQVNEGALFVNYTGHGGELGWAGENVLTIPEIYAWENDGRLPVFVTATCEFSRFDDPERISAGEHVILRNQGGGIALFTTTRIAYSHTNAFLNQSFYKVLFAKNPAMAPRLGDLVMQSKNMSNNNDKVRNFALLGDPALAPAFPGLSIATTHINNIPVETFSDTLKACQRVTVTGQITDKTGHPVEPFNGLLYFAIFDKTRTLRTLGNDPESKPSPFKIRNQVIAKGTAQVSSGKFEFTFIIPKDIDLAFGNGKFSYYATDSLSDAAGAYTGFILGGIDPNLANDRQGPEINMYLDDPNFVPGNLTSPNPLFMASLADSSGINILGIGLGHDIAIWLDDNTQDAIILNDWFRPLNPLNTQGKITYPFKNLPEGPHTLTLRAWDLQGNSNQKTISFYVAFSSDVVLSQLINRPNPFNERTWFFFEHNQPSNTLKVTIEIYNLQGTRLKTLKQQTATSGYQIPPIEWDGRSDNGNKLPAGIYPYKVIVENAGGNITTRKQKLVIIR